MRDRESFTAVMLDVGDLSHWALRVQLAYVLVLVGHRVAHRHCGIKQQINAVKVPEQDESGRQQ